VLVHSREAEKTRRKALNVPHPFASVRVKFPGKHVIILKRSPDV